MPTSIPLQGEDLGIHGMQTGAQHYLQTANDLIPIDGFLMGDQNIPPGKNYVRDPSLITTDAQGRQVTQRWNTGQAGVNNHFGRNVALMMLLAAAGGVGVSALGAGAVGEGTALAGAGIGADESLGLAMGNPFAGAAATGAGTGASTLGYVDTLGDAITGASAGAPTTGALPVAGAGAGVGGGTGYVDTIGDAITGGQAGVPTTGAAPVPGAGVPPGSTGYMDTIGDGITGADSGASLTGDVTPNFWEQYASKIPGLISKLPGILGAFAPKPGQGAPGGAPGMGGMGGKAVDGVMVQPKKVEVEQNPFAKPPKTPPIKSLGDYLKGG